MPADQAGGRGRRDWRRPPHDRAGGAKGLRATSTSVAGPLPWTMTAMKRLLAAALLALTALVPASAAEPPPATVTAARPSPEQQQWLSRARRTERDGWIHLRIDGAPRERGFQHGYLLAKEIESSLRTTRKRWEYRSGMDWPWLVGKAEAMFLPKIDAELVAEIDGMVGGPRGGRGEDEPRRDDRLQRHHGARGLLVAGGEGLDRRPLARRAQGLVQQLHRDRQHDRATAASCSATTR